MKPFSPLYFIKENKARCILLMFMIFLSYGIYLGGLYITNPMDNWKVPLAYYEQIACVHPAASDDEEFTEYEAFKRELQQNEQVTVLELGLHNTLNWKTVMGFTSGSVTFAFQTPEDFRTYCYYMDIQCDFDAVRSGSIVMSERYARNLGLSVGDTIDKDYKDTIYDSYTLHALTQEEGYILYQIDNEPYDSQNLMILGNGISGQELYDIIYDVQSRHNVSVYDMLEQQIRPQFEIFEVIYGFVVIFLSMILAITIHAAFVGMYQRRSFEFAVYRAIGVARKRIIGKIIGELLLMDGITLLVGGAVFFLGLYLFNNMMLYPVGKYLCYFDPLALLGLVLCNAIVLIPLIVTRSRQLLRADICEY